MVNRSLSALHASYLSLRDWHVLLVFSNRYRECQRGCWYLHQPQDDRSCNLLFKLSLAEIVEFGIRDSIWGTFAWFRKHLINIGTEADFIKIFVLNSHKDKGGKKTASRTTRLPRLLIMIRLSKVHRICCYKTIFSYISFTFCHGFAVVPCNSGRNLWVYICLFHHANQVRFLISFIWIST